MCDPIRKGEPSFAALSVVLMYVFELQSEADLTQENPSLCSLLNTFSGWSGQGWLPAA